MVRFEVEWSLNKLRKTLFESTWDRDIQATAQAGKQSNNTCSKPIKTNFSKSFLI